MQVDTTSVSLGSIFAEFENSDIDILINWLEKMSIIVESGVQSVGPPAAYALVWEWGNARQTKKGPKTVKGINPDGSSVWLSMQAPRGWISITEPKMWKVIEEELGKIELDTSINTTQIKSELDACYDRIADRCLELLHETVPIDSGDLYDSLEKVPPGSSELKEMESLAGEMAEILR